MWDGQMGLGMDGSPWVGSGIEHFMVLIRLVPNKLHLHKSSTSISYEQSMFNFITFANFFLKNEMYVDHISKLAQKFLFLNYVFKKFKSLKTSNLTSLLCFKEQVEINVMLLRNIVNNVNLIMYSEVLLLQQNGK